MKQLHALDFRIPEPEKMTPDEEKFYAQADYSVPHEIMAEEICSVLKPGMHVADLGCGPGDILIRLRKRGDWNLWGVDFSTGMLDLAVKNFLKRHGDDIRPVNWIIADIKKTALPDHFFDCCVSNSVLHHMSDPVAFWREIKRITKKDGFIKIRDLRRPKNNFEADALVEKHVGNESAIVKNHYRSSLASAFTVAEVQKHLQDAGLFGLSVLEQDDRYLDIAGYVQP